MRAVVEQWQGRGAQVVEPRPATREELARVHDEAYLDRLAASAGRPSMLDPDTFTSADSYDVARLAAGAACLAVETALARDAPAFAVVRPPGHHAERDQRHGLLPLQQRRRGGGACPGTGLHARGRDGLRRPPRQRHAVDVLRRCQRALSLDAPVSLLPGNRRGRRGRPRRRRGLHRQRAACRRGGRRGLRCGLPPGRRAGAEGVRRRRCCSCRPASTCTHAIPWAACAYRPRASPGSWRTSVPWPQRRGRRIAWSWSPRAATTSRPWRPVSRPRSARSTARPEAPPAVEGDTPTGRRGARPRCARHRAAGWATL